MASNKEIQDMANVLRRDVAKMTTAAGSGHPTSCFSSAEIEEICVANKTMSYKEYTDCRLFNLTVEIFYNNGVFKGLINFLERFNISGSSLIRNVYNSVINRPENINDVYEDYLKENEDKLGENKLDLEKYLKE